MSNLATPIWVRFPNLPIHMRHPTFLEELGNLLGCFIKIDLERIMKGIHTFTHICVKVVLNEGLSDKILLKWGKKVIPNRWIMKI